MPSRTRPDVPEVPDAPGAPSGAAPEGPTAGEAHGANAARGAGGAGREKPAPAAPDPARVGGPRRWVVSVGVLSALGILGMAGAFVVDGGGGSGSAAEAPGTIKAADGAWSAATVAPVTPGSTAGSGTAGAAGAAGAGASPDRRGVVADGDTAARPDAGDGVRMAALSSGDRAAGLTTTRLVQAGSGRFTVVPGSVAAPRNAPIMKVRVEVEDGIGVDGPAFAAFVMDTLNDDRSWGHGGTMTFARTSGPADIQVVLASPDTSARLCAPARTFGTMSCGGGGRAVLTMYRWLNGIPDYGTNRTDYRHYVVNHEVGHVLGHGHAYCDPGHLAPVMVQQTKGLHGCLPNAWPFPVRR